MTSEAGAGGCDGIDSTVYYEEIELEETIIIQTEDKSIPPAVGMELGLLTKEMINFPEKIIIAEADDDIIFDPIDELCSNLPSEASVLTLDEMNGHNFVTSFSSECNKMCQSNGYMKRQLPNNSKDNEQCRFMKSLMAARVGWMTVYPKFTVKISLHRIIKGSRGLYFMDTVNSNSENLSDKEKKFFKFVDQKEVGVIVESMRKIFARPVTEQNNPIGLVSFSRYFYSVLESLGTEPLLLPFIEVLKNISIDGDIERTGLDMDNIPGPLQNIGKFSEYKPHPEDIHRDGSIPGLNRAITTIGFTASCTSTHAGEAIYGGQMSLLNQGGSVYWIVIPPSEFRKVMDLAQIWYYNLAPSTMKNGSNDEQLESPPHCILQHKNIMFGPQFLHAIRIKYEILEQKSNELIYFCAKTIIQSVFTNFAVTKNVCMIGGDMHVTYEDEPKPCSHSPGLGTLACNAAFSFMLFRKSLEYYRLAGESSYSGAAGLPLSESPLPTRASSETSDQFWNNDIDFLTEEPKPLILQSAARTMHSRRVIEVMALQVDKQQCEFCSATYKRTCHLNRHKRTCRLNPNADFFPEFYCKPCKRTFSDVTNYNLHICSIHQGIGQLSPRKKPGKTTPP